MKSDDIISGLTNYTEMEIMNHMDTLGKWAMGAAIIYARKKASTIFDNLANNEMIKTLGLCDYDGDFDVDEVLNCLSQSATQYGGHIHIEIPMVGKLTFTPNDIQNIRRYL